MADRSSPEGDGDLDAGDFSSWIVEVQAAIRRERGSDVPCGGCTACCTSSQFVHIAPDEADALAFIPPTLLFPAPGRPPGHVLLGYDERGRCPMLGDDGCSIYEHRPMTCRTYDCRIFPAAGIEPDGADKVGIARRVRRWRFRFPAPAGAVEHRAVRAASRFLAEQPGFVPGATAPIDQTRLAVLAVEAHAAFLSRDEETGAVVVADPDSEAVRAELARHRGPLAP